MVRISKLVIFGVVALVLGLILVVLFASTGVSKANAALATARSSSDVMQTEIDRLKAEKIVAGNKVVTLEAAVVDLMAAKTALEAKQKELEGLVAQMAVQNKADQAKIVEMGTPPEWTWDSTFQGLEPFYKNIDKDIVGFADSTALAMSYECTTGYGIFGTMDPSTVRGVPTVLGSDPVGAVIYSPCKVGEVIEFSTTFWSEKSKNIPGHWSVHFNELTKPLPEDVTIEEALLAHMDGEKKAIALLFDATGEYKLLTR